MTEAEWLCCPHPDKMLRYLDGKVSDRKFWLFACSCCRLIWHRFSDWRIRRVVEAAELFADGRDAGEHLAAARSAVNVSGKAGVGGFVHLLDETRSGSTAAHRCISGIWSVMAKRPIRLNTYPSLYSGGVAGWEPLCQKLVLLVHDIAGNPFSPVSPDPAWLKANGGAAVRIAREIYEDRAFNLMPILADALEDAGCTNEQVLAHCRKEGFHARGCFVLDLVLDRK